MPISATSSARALGAILPLIESGQPYEAHQKARTFASRYSKSAQYDTAVDVLFQSARELLKKGQQGSGIDLAGFMLDVYESKGEVVGEESRGRLTQLIALTGPSGLWRKTLIDKSISWSAKNGPCPGGDPDLQHYVGELLYKDGDFQAAEPHLLASGQRDSARLLADMMIDWSAAGGTPGIYVLRGIIPYLQNGNILAAHTFVTHFTTTLISRSPSYRSRLQPTPLPVGPPDHTNGEVAVTTDPVLNFCQLAVLTCQRAQGDRNKSARESWVRLCVTYQTKGGILASPEVRKALQELSQLYFAIPPPRTQPANPFGEMLSSLFAGGQPGAGTPAQRVLSPSNTGSSSPRLD